MRIKQKKTVLTASHRRLTSDDQLGGGRDIVNGRLCRAGVVSTVLQLGILDEQSTV